jgi:hypothetical protein
MAGLSREIDMDATADRLQVEYPATETAFDNVRTPPGAGEGFHHPPRAPSPYQLGPYTQGPYQGVPTPEPQYHPYGSPPSQHFHGELNPYPNQGYPPFEGTPPSGHQGEPRYGF